MNKFLSKNQNCSMLNIMLSSLHSSSEWMDIYGTNEPSHIYSTNQYYSGYSGDFYVRNVVFENLGSSCAIYFSSSDTRSLVSSSTFINLTSSLKASSIYIINGQSALIKVCSIGSTSTSENGARFARIFATNSASSINFNSQLSVTLNNRGSLVG